MALDGSHWYRPDASACFELPKKSGKGMKSPTIRDARELGLLPSVTTILSVLAKPELERWKHRQVAMAALTHPKDEQAVLDDSYLDTVIADAFQQVGDAADLGTAIHKAIEDHFQGRSYDESLAPHVRAVDEWWGQQDAMFTHHELRLASTQHGFAGTTDAAFTKGNLLGILDFKSRKTQPGMPCAPWSGQATQIAAYYVARYGWVDERACGVNVFISTTEPGRVAATWYDAATLRAEWEFFQHVAACWRHLRGYDPRQP